MNKQIGALVLIAIMVASYAALFAFQGGTPTINPTPTPTPTPPSNTPQNTTPIHYTSTPFPATIQSILPSVFFTAQTTQANINLLDQKLYALKGVRNITSYYRQLQPDSLTYVAQVQLDPSANRDAFVQSASEIPELSNVQALGSALIQVPETLELQNEDLNLSQNHTFKNRDFSVLVSLQTQPNDVIQAQLVLDLAGDVVSNVQGIELSNPSIQSLPDGVDQNATLSSVQQRFLVSGSVSYTPTFDENALNTSIQSLPHVVSASTNWGFYPILDVFWDGNWSGKENDLNQSLHDVNGIVPRSFELTTLHNSMSIQFGNGADLKPLETAITNRIHSMQSNAAPVFREPSYNFLSTVSTDQNDLSSVVSPLDALMKQQHALYTAGQTSYVDLNTYFSPDLNQTVPISVEHIPTISRLGRTAHQTVPLHFQFTIVRGVAIQAVAAEDGSWLTLLNQSIGQ